jgi:ribosomal-protein-alanine N-acetyltransferase
VDAVYALEQRCFPTPWPRADLLRDLSDNPLAVYVVCETEGRLVGYAGLWAILDEGHLTNVAVDPEFRNGGVATMMLTKLFETAREKGTERFTLEVRRSNGAAQSLYRKFGFRTVGYRTRYYQDNGEDAAVMWMLTEDVLNERE